MLEARNISFRYNNRSPWILQNIDLTVTEGEVAGLAGPSGNGKSTLGKILSGYLKPHTGTIRLDSKPDSLFTSGTFCPVQLLFQHPELAVNPRWTIEKILFEAGTPDSALMTALGIDPAWFARYPHELSGGELQRVCLVRALDNRVRYLICDEITSMLDALTQAAIWKAVLDAAGRRNIGMLVISHDAALLARICSRQISLFTQ
ncbi:ABC transporter ATP-binding protein [Oleidesulfovibrio sp.]|uniref:ABC transporter ATP-binding protein n=1 Tax=Oleidesulfovibrio sp. TaxID=2909707 RepID=UPI003A8C1A56